MILRKPHHDRGANASRSNIARTHPSRSPRWISWFLALTLLAAITFNIGMGVVSATPREIITVISQQVWQKLEHSFVGAPMATIGHALTALPLIDRFVTWIDVEVPRQVQSVVWNIRMPRTLMATMVGAGLAVVGTGMQGLLRNPLADPWVLGVSSGGAFGALLAGMIGFNLLGQWSTPVVASIGALLVLAIIYRIARHNDRTEVVTLLLAGIALAAFLNAAVGVIIATQRTGQTISLAFWTMGSFSGSRWSQLGIVTLITIVGGVVTYWYARPLNLLALGEREARHLGIEITRMRWVLFTVFSCIVGASVAYAGAIGFLGLIVPHALRLVVGPDHRRVIPLAAVAGATIMLCADLAARMMIQPLEIPVGAITTLIGGPIFLWLIVRVRSQQGGWG